MPASNTAITTFDGDLTFFATCGTGLEALLDAEFKSLGFKDVQTAGAGVRFSGKLADAYKACLWSRLANRILLPVHKGSAGSPEELYSLVQQIDWQQHLHVDGSLAVDFFTANSQITHSQYGALKVKDAVVDQFRVNQGRRPDVDRQSPDVRINVYLFRDNARIAIDLSGSSLHRRGYRSAAGLAPLKENLAAAILAAINWSEAVEKGQPLFDPMCGSATLLIEAAMIASNTAPGLLREYFGFKGWKHHDQSVWQALLTEARESVRASPVLIGGADQDEAAVESARQNVAAAGLQDTVSLWHQPLSYALPTEFSACQKGIVVTNPPYGERLAADARFYAEMGAELSRQFGGWYCALFTATTAPSNRMRLPLKTLQKAHNGGIDCVLLGGYIPASVGVRSKSTEVVEAGIDATPFVNRLKKNQKGLKGWLKQNSINAYRLYDADLPDFAVAIDIYNGDRETHCVVQEYEAPATVNLAVAQQRLDAVLHTLPACLNIPHEHIHLKVRQKKTGSDQYEKRVASGTKTLVVEELGARLELNLSDYLDTGLFLDHRPVRRFIKQNAAGKRFLNLFSYTGSATVAAVLGQASTSVSVDSSNRYCQWAKRNLDNNGAAAQLHEVVRQDVFAWLEAAQPGASGSRLFDMVLLDPPTFSNSTDNDRDWNVQRDHVEIINACLRLMAPGALLIFSNNYRRFKPDDILLADTNSGLHVENRSRWSIDRDFHRNQRIHQCWFIYKK